jgi:Skp family chaperone for outer membrane proteins
MRQALVVFVLAGVSVGAAAQEAKVPKIAVVSLQRVFRDSLLGKGYAAQLDALQKDLDSRIAKSQADVQKMDAALKVLQDDLEKQGAALAGDARQQKQQDLTRKGRERQAFVVDAQSELQGVRGRAEQQANNLRGEFRAKVQPFIEAVAKEKSIDILLQQESSTIAVLGRDADLTPAVVAKADEAQKAPKASTPKPTPPPSAKP